MCEYSTINHADVLRRHAAPKKDPAISFTVNLVENMNSSPENGILGSEVPANGAAVTFDEHRYPKLQSFKSASHSMTPNKILLVGGRYLCTCMHVHLRACHCV